MKGPNCIFSSGRIGCNIKAEVGRHVIHLIHTPLYCLGNDSNGILMSKVVLNF